MSDPYPSNLSIEIDRQVLKKYLRVRWLLSWATLFALLGGLFGLASIGNALERSVTSRGEVVFVIFKCVGTGLGISLLLALIFYLLFSHRVTSRMANSLEVSVEGAFLRIKQRAYITSDRKLHFRSIVDYTVMQDFLMRRFGIHALHMTTTAGGQNTGLVVTGLKDCLKVRDMLADIDSRRENH
jgi:hypothetical protein